MVTGFKPASEHSSDIHNTFAGGLKKKPTSRDTRFFWFHIATLVCNVCLVALYTTQVYTPHTECLVNDQNITQRFDLAFRLGLVAMFSEFLSLMGVLMLPTNNTQKEGEPKFMISKSLWCDAIIKFSIIACSAVQAMIVVDEKSLICSKVMSTLTLESKWLAALVISQLVKTIFFTVLQFSLYRFNTESDDDQGEILGNFKLDLEQLQTQNSYADFENMAMEFQDQEESPLCAKRFNAEGISEVSTDIDYFQFSPTIPQMRQSLERHGRRTAHFSRASSYGDKSIAESVRKEKRKQRKKHKEKIIRPTALLMKYESISPSLSCTNKLTKQLNFEPETDEGFTTPSFAVPYPTERQKRY